MVIRTDLIRDLYHGFFDPDTRKALGEFYTKDEIVDEVLDFLKYDEKTVKKILNEDRILVDASCGSGTFLVRTISRWNDEIKEASSDPIKSADLLRKITNNVIGIDIHPFAVAMARVNYLLAIVDLLSPNVINNMSEVVIPIYWTDSLVIREASISSRIDKGSGYKPVEIEIPILGKFILPRPDDIDWVLLAAKVRTALDNKWSANRFLEEFPEEQRLVYRDILINLYGWFEEREKAGKDGRWISVLTNSIAIYKLQGKCSYVVGNPPWVRIHNIDKSIRDRIKRNFSFYKSGWTPNLLKTKARFKEQYDYCMAFVESGLRLLVTDGVLGFVITSKVMQSLYSGSMRKNLLENTKILYLKDYSLSKIQLFRDATNYPLILVIKKSKPGQNKIHVEIVVREKTKSWETKQEELPVFTNDHMSPWMIAPPDVVKAFRKMQIFEHDTGFSRNARAGDLYEINMGVKTSANDIFLVKQITRSPTQGLVIATTEGKENILIEEELLLPFVRGEGISQFSYFPSGYIIWAHDNDGIALKKLPANAEQYFMQKDRYSHLANRTDYKKSMPIWTIFRISKTKLEQKAAWHELSRRMEAVFLPKEYDDPVLGKKRLIVIQTVYFISSVDEKFCSKMVLLLNSTPIRAFIKSFAERAMGGYFRHISWTVGLVPIPNHIDELPINLKDPVKINEAVSKIYRLTNEETKAISDYDSFIEKEVIKST